MSLHLTIDPEFKGKIPPLREEELKQLEENILADGVIINPLIVWDDMIVDGHNRYRILQKHPEIQFTTYEKEFPDRDAAIAWICKNQLGRRNLTPQQFKYLVGQRYEAEKQSKGIEFQGNQYTSQDRSGLGHFGAVDKIYKGYLIWYNRKKHERVARMQLKIHMVTIEDLMPQDHFLRKLEKALDLSFVYEETRHLYSQKYGRPPIDPVVLVKYLLVGFLYGIPSERQIEKRIETDIALRWYLGLDLLDRVPDHSTISQLRRRKPEFRNVFRRLFHVVVQQCIAEGLVTGKIVATDSTHMKANASVSSECLVEV